MAQSRNYWLATAQPKGHPHAVPVWGVWVDDTLYFGGGSHTRWARNLAANPKVAVHLDDSDEVVILEGNVEQISEPDSLLVTRIADAYEEKFEMRHPPPFWVLRPSVVFAWAPFPDAATRWHFGEDA